MNPNTKRSQTLRAKRKAQGLTEVRGIWAKPKDHARIKRMHRAEPQHDQSTKVGVTG